MKQASRDGFTFDSFGRCIYCPRTEVLTREHIVPHAFGGRHLITEGSCDVCIKETHAFEGAWAGKMLGPFRGDKWPSKKKNRRPKVRQVIVEREGVKIPVEVPWGEEPPTPIMAPILPIAGILLGKEPSNSVVGDCKIIMPSIADAAPRMQKISKQYVASSVTVRGFLDVNAYMRLLAKIAHGFCVVMFGIDAFEHLLPKYILGKDDHYYYVIGGNVEPFSGDPTSEYNVVPMLRYCNCKWYATAVIQLFSSLGFPLYEVVAGEASPDLVRVAQSSVSIL